MATDGKPAAVDRKRLRSQRLREVNFQGDALRLGVNWTVEDLGKPQVLVESAYGMGHPGTFHFRGLIEEVSNGVYEAGGKPAEFVVSDICDGVVQATEGMSYSLISRDVMAAMIEIHALGHPHDATVLISGNDKSVPAHLVAMARCDLPAVHVPGGTQLNATDYVTSNEMWDMGAAVRRGDATLSIRGDEAEQAWRIVTTVLEGWSRGVVPLEEYDAGSHGPERRGEDEGAHGHDRGRCRRLRGRSGSSRVRRRGGSLPRSSAPHRVRVAGARHRLRRFRASGGPRHLGCLSHTRPAGRRRCARGGDEGAPVAEAEALEVQGHPADVLIEQGDDTALIVVGRRGLGGFRSLLLGSVSHQVVQHATSPVVVVNQPAPDS